MMALRREKSPDKPLIAAHNGHPARDNGLIAGRGGYSPVMTALRHRPARIVGMEWGTALLAIATCLIFTAGIAALTGTLSTAIPATVALALGLFITLRILRPTS